MCLGAAQGFQGQVGAQVYEVGEMHIHTKGKQMSRARYWHLEESGCQGLVLSLVPLFNKPLYCKNENIILTTKCR